MNNRYEELKPYLKVKINHIRDTGESYELKTEQNMVKHVI